MLLFFHGEAGGWDELIIAAIAIGVLWVAVKLSGRKPVDEDEDESENDDTAVPPQADEQAARPPATPLG